MKIKYFKYSKHFLKSYFFLTLCLLLSLCLFFLSCASLREDFSSKKERKKSNLQNKKSKKDRKSVVGNGKNAKNIKHPKYTKDKKSNFKKEMLEEKNQKFFSSENPNFPRLSKIPHYRTGVYRKYRRLSPKMQKESLERKKRVLVDIHEEKMKQRIKDDSHSGSLWVSEGQGAYLFAENTLREIGDPITVILKGPPKDQLVAKNKVIINLLSKMHQKQKASSLYAHQVHSQKKNEEKPKVFGNQDQTVKRRKPSSVKEPLIGSFQVESVPARIIKRISHDQYQIEGHQTLLIGKRQYSVIVIGIVRPQDLLEDKIEAPKLIDAYFDIVKPIKRVNL